MTANSYRYRVLRWLNEHAQGHQRRAILARAAEAREAARQMERDGLTPEDAGRALIERFAKNTTPDTTRRNQ